MISRFCLTLNSSFCKRSCDLVIKFSAPKVKKCCQTGHHVYRPFIQQKCSFHTSSRRQLGIPPVIWLVVKPALKLGAIISGRVARTRWGKLPRNIKLKIFLGLLGPVTIFTGYYYESHKQVAPVTNRERFLFHTPDQFAMIVEAEAAKKLEESKAILVSANHPYYQRVKVVFQKLVLSNLDIEELKSHKWKIFILEDASPNAAVLPNGYVFVNTGLMEFVHNDDQLAIVLAHEMAHAVLSHSAEVLNFSQLMDYLVIIVMAFLWMMIPNDGIAIVTHWYLNKCSTLMIDLPYSRLLESEADRVGLRFAAKACYDIREGSVFWRMMQINSELSGEAQLEWLSTHPLSEKRAEAVDFLVPKVLPFREECQCAPLPALDPRSKMPAVRNTADNIIAAQKSRQNLCRMTKVTDVKRS